MADNTVLNPGVGGDTVATDDIGGVKYQIVKLATGALDTATLALSGSGTATGAIRVELPTNGTGVVGLNAGSNVIGHVITDTGSTTAVTGTVTISGAVTNAALTTADLDTGAGTDTRGVSGIALGKSGGAIILNSGSQTSANSLPVVIASDQASIPVAATLSAETTKVIGVTRTADGSGNLITSTTNALDINIKSGNLTTLPVTNAGTFAVQDTVLDAAIISQEATTSGVKGLTAFGAVTTNAPSYTTAKSDALSLDTSGLLRVSLKDTPANTNKLLVTADAITFASPQHIIADSGTISTITNVVHVDDNSGSLTVDGTVTANAGTGTFTVAGGKTNNNAAPGATNVGALVGLATAAAQSWTEGNLVALSTDLAGNLRVTGSLSVGGTTDNSAYTAGTSTGTPSMGFYHSTIDTVTDGRAASLAIDSKRNLFNVIRDAAGNARGANVNASNQLSVSVDNSPVLGAGSAVIGHVITDATSVTAATLSAETTKVIGVVRTADGTGNLLTSTSNALDINIKSGNLTTLPVTNAGTFAVQNTTQKNASPASTSMQTAATGNGNGTNLATDGFSTAIVSITASVGMGGGTTINFEASTDNTTFVSVQAINVGTNTIATTTIATGDWQVDVTGYSFLRARISAYSAGTITIKGWPIGIVGNSKVINANIVAGSAVIGHVISDSGSVTNATLSAETTKVIGVVRTADGSGNLLTSTSQALDINIKSGSIANTAFIANAGTNLNTSALALEAGGNLDDIDAALDASVISQEATTSGTKGITAYGAVTTAKPTYTTAKSDALSLDVNGLLRVSLADTPANGSKFLVTADPITGTVTANAGTNLNTSSLALDATLTGVIRAEDTASADADKGIGALAIRKATPANTSGTDGDYEYLQVSAGRLWASATIDTALPAGSAVIGHVITDTNSVTNATLSAETTKVIGVTRTSDGAGNLLTSNSTTYTAKFGLDSNLLGTLGTAFSTAGKVDVKGADGDVFVRQTTGSNLHTVLDSGTLTTLTTLTGITNTVVTDDLAASATGAAVPANAMYGGGLAQTALPTAASTGNLTGNLEDKFGRQVVLPNAMRDIMGTQTTTITSSTSETTIATAVASTFLDLVSLFISNTSATATRVDIRDTTAGSVIFQLYIPAGDMRGLSLTTPWPQTTVNTNWTATCGTSVADVRISALYIKNK